MTSEITHNYFTGCDFLEEGCTGISVRFDFYSHPDFCEYFLSEFRNMVTVDGSKFKEGELSSSLQRSDVNLDLVAEALDSVIERISGAPVYVYYDLTSLFDAFETDRPSAAKLYLSQYYVCLFTKNIAVNDKVFQFAKLIYTILKKAWVLKILTLSDCQFITRSRSVIDEDYFSTKRFVNGMAFVDDSQVTFLKKTISLEGEISCTVDNIFRHGYVEELEMEGWEQSLETVATLRFQSQVSNYEVNEVWNNLINKTKKSVKICVEFTD